MKRAAPFFAILLTMLILVGCQETGDTDTDIEAAQSFFPSLAGYTTYETESIQEAVTTALGGAGVLTGNVVQAALVERIDSLISCYRRTGAVDARIFVEQVSNLDSVRVPIAGVLAVINQDRIRDNFLACISDTPLDGVLGTQSVEPEPCTGSGTFEFEGDTISYLYAATDKPLCGLFNVHFAQFQG